jgi:UDP-2,3-diacylglucosamine pyrophosphatase LpxH
MDKKQSSILKALDKSYAKAQRIPLTCDDVRWIIFSDHHRGSKDGADDFLPCEQTYLNALDHYDAEDYSLCLLGDVEEFWENTPLSVMSKYLNVLQSEKRFWNKEKLHRIWGNHDDDWRIAGPVTRHLGGLFPKIKVNESIVLELSEGNSCRDVLLVHGHQGTLDSDRWAWASRLFVRFIWRNVQRVFKVPLSTPSNNIKLKSEHDKAMYEWADTRDKVVICGHTHHPVFMSYTHADRARKELKGLIAIQKTEPSPEKKEAIAILREEIKKIERDEGQAQIKSKPKPFYFNSGCCSFSDGDITGLELSDGEIRLVKWSSKDGKRNVMGTTKLSFLMRYR